MNRLFLFPMLCAASFLFPQDSFSQQFVYVLNSSDNTISVIDTATDMVVGSPIPAGPPELSRIAITPDGSRAYVTSGFDNNAVTVIDTVTNMIIGSIPLSADPFGIAITPDGSRAYVTLLASSGVTVIDTATNTVLVTFINTGEVLPFDIAIAPDGSRAYVVNMDDSSVSVIDIATNTLIGSPIPSGAGGSIAIAITPDGTRAYVVNFDSENVTIIDTTTNMMIGSPIEVGSDPFDIAITPDGTRAYVVNQDSDNVTVIDITNNMVIDPPIQVGTRPTQIAITPDGSRAYVPSGLDNAVTVIDTATNMVIGSPIEVGAGPSGLAITVVPSPDISLSPDSAENSILTQQTLTALVEVDETLQQGVLVNFEVQSGPNRGESSSPGECFPNTDCTTDANGQVSWTYTGGPDPGTDTVRASFFNIAEQREESSNAALITWTSPISLSPTNATNEIRTEHTVTALIEFNGSPESGILVDFEIIAGPNLGEPGECMPNTDCTTDGNGEVSWTYTSGGRLGTDTIVASFFDDQFQATVDSNLVFKTWVLPERNIPTMSEWGLIATAGLLGLFSLFMLRKRKITS